MGTISFHVLFEKMLHQTLRAIQDSPLLKQVNSSPKWHLLNPYNANPPQDPTYQTLTSSNQYVDILIHYSDVTILADAKYYKADSQMELEHIPIITDLPSTKEVRKQIFYAEVLKKRGDISTLLNYFIFPFGNQAYEMEDFYYMGNISWNEFTNNNDKIIEAFGIHLERLMSAYVQNRYLELPIYSSVVQ